MRAMYWKETLRGHVRAVVVGVEMNQFVIVSLPYHKMWISVMNINDSPAAIDCGSPPPVQNGKVDQSDGTTLDSVLTYSCDSGYELDNTNRATRTCTRDGTWSFTAPQCVGMFLVTCLTEMSLNICLLLFRCRMWKPCIPAKW